MKKGGGPALRQELGDISYLKTHPEAFALSFDGSKVLIGKEEVQVDETLIVEVA